MSHYSTARLEGRALEHALAGEGGFRIRMKNAEGVFDWVGGTAAKDIRMMMTRRVEELKADLKGEGLHVQDADCPVRLGGMGGEERSVDLRLWSSKHNCGVLVEVKWTRRGLNAALKHGRKSLPMLKEACRSGMWSRSRNKVNASMVGVLVVTPTLWHGTLSDVEGSASFQYPSPTAHVPRKRQSGTSLSGSLKRKTNPHSKSLDKKWRKSTKGNKMKKKHLETYRTSTKGKKMLRESNKKAYLKRTPEAQ